MNKDKEKVEMNVTQALLQAIVEIADKCETLEEFREALARIKTE